MGALLDFLRRSSPAVPPTYPPAASEAAIIHGVQRYLRRTGWTLLPPFDWMNVRIRAEKPGMVLNLAVFHPKLKAWASLIRDTCEDSFTVSQTIGIIAAHAVPEHARLAAGESGIFAITTEELGDIENILHVIATRAAERRRIALET